MGPVDDFIDTTIHNKGTTWVCETTYVIYLGSYLLNPNYVPHH